MFSLLLVMTLSQYPQQQGKGQDGGAWNISGNVTVSGTPIVAVTGSTSITIDGGVIAWTRPCICGETSISKCGPVTNVASRFPIDGGLAPRSYLVLTNSNQNTGNVKCLSTGAVPVFAAGNPGDYMSPGDKPWVYSVPDLLADGGTHVNCISDQAGGTTAFCAYECACSP